MAKENKKKSAKKNGYDISPWILFFISVILLIGSWLIKSFPLLIFIALSPLFAMADKSNSEEKFWNHAELILIALTTSLLASHVFDIRFLIGSITQAIGFTLAFIGYGFVLQSLGPKAGKMTIVLFWLTIEYIFLKLTWPSEAVFLADALQLKTNWLNWTYHTGYLGSSLWILLANLLFYLSIFKDGKPNWVWLIFFLILVITPIIYSFTTEVTLTLREQMLSLYSNTSNELNSNYLKRGEFIPRTAAWISVLIFIFALVKSKTQKR